MVYVIKTKKVIIYTSLLLSVIFCFNIIKNFTVGVSAPPPSNHVIIIDPGHGGADGGAIAQDGTVEKDLNLQISLKLQDLLSQSGCTVFMTRADDRSLSSEEDDLNRMRKVADLNNRKAMTEELEVDAFISIHMNTFTDPQYYGTQVFYSSDDDKSKLLAEYIQEEIRLIDPDNTRESKSGKGNIFILNETTVPSVVVECGFLSNQADLERLKSEEYQNMLAGAIYNGITRFYSS